MATWGEYGSLIQLGAGLNFAYAGLEVILNKPLSILRARHETYLGAIRSRLRDRSAGRTGSGRTSAFRNARASDALGVARFVDDAISRLNPYVATLSGTVATLMLGYASDHAGDKICTAWRELSWLVGFGWFFLTLLAMGACRLSLAVFAAPVLRTGR